MYIRKTTIKSKKSGGAYFSYRLVESERIGQQVKQKTLLNLGKHFDVDPRDWPLLVERIEQITQGSKQQVCLFDMKEALDQPLETAAQRYAALLINKLSNPAEKKVEALNDTAAEDLQTVDLNSLSASQARSIGGETLALHALKQLGLKEVFTDLGFNKKESIAASSEIIGRMLHPGSERETHRWLQHDSALGECLDYDTSKVSLNHLYRVSDKLWSNKTSIEAHLAQREASLFDLERTLILYDLTNTYFEGESKGNNQAQRGRSKEKRSDCPLVTMGLVLDGDGFPVGSELFAGNASEPKTLQVMLESLHLASDQQGHTVVLDAGLASEDNIQWLKSHGYRYIVVSRERYKERPELADGAVIVKDKTADQVIAKRVIDPDSNEVRLYCHSEKREAKDQSIRSQFASRYEDRLNKLNAGLSKKGTVKRYEKVLERIGRLKEKHARVASDYTLEVQTNAEKTVATAIVWQRHKSTDVKESLSGVYCLRSNDETLSEQALWKTYVMLTDVEASFRSMKSELGLRPIYHQKEQRVSAHLFITLLAYHLVHTLRRQLQEKGISLSWASLRNIMATQQRMTVSLITAEQHSIHVRTTTKAEPMQQTIFDALNIAHDAVGMKKTIISKKD